MPVYLDRVWGSVFSFKGGRFFWKLPARLPYPVTVAFGAPLPASTAASEVRLALQAVGARATALRRGRREVLGRRFIAAAKERWGAFCMADAMIRLGQLGAGGDHAVRLAALVVSDDGRHLLAGPCIDPGGACGQA